MLMQLNIKNFALIEEITVEFQEGFNILSGETGAGKSILIDAIDYVLGGKFSKDLIRTGKDRTYVEAIFSSNNKNINAILEEMGIEYEDILIISRETLLSGKSIVKVNGKSLIVSQLKKIREKLLDIHGQHQNQTLLQRGSHILYLDNFIGREIEEPLNEFLKLKYELHDIRKKIDNIKGSEDREKLIDYTKFQIDDIEKGKLTSNEEEELKEEYNILSNAEKINSSLKISYDLLYSREDGNSILESLSKVISEMSSIEKHLEPIKEKREILEGAYFNIQEISREIRDIASGVTYDENRLSKINERIYEINTYKKKYGPTIEDVLEFYKKLKEKYEELINAEEIINDLKLKENSILENLREVGNVLHDIRCKYSEPLEKRILNELSYVGLEKSRMNIEVELEDNIKERGFDEVVIMISTNPGEPLKPLEKVLSGGELSRIMLALKCVFADKDDISTLIFDEIDTGISGEVGQRVGEKMYEVSLGHQVLCITHLPQIAILSDYHFFVSKEVKDEKTFTKIDLLSINEKIKQVASMLGGREITEATLENVREMLRFSENKKHEIKENRVHK
ncbi:DNA repair protein RecN [Clostridium sp. SHJSY1]|uniref:DNA repair protein RecN n=1 Tax=Clostridium sp. SHJSY1 TaxID=2942483 RepID=UPI00287554BF|nr:DNA repair protein RecN [Clostridium sp. SHJSY1]MDS0527866.1 DNA repair protein RecN [Clostridium sp. SHJSY1]